MTGALMWETETLYSALGKKGRMGDGRSEWGRNVISYSSLLLFSLSIPPPPWLPPSPPEMHTRLEYGGAHTRGVCVCVCGLVKRQNRAEASDMHVRMPWIQHHGTPLALFSFFFFSLTLTFLLFFLLLLFSNFIWVFWFLVQKSYY